MGKYDPLRDHLASLDGNRWDTTFSILEKRVLGFKLPKSAREYQAWWSNEGTGTHVQARSWLKAGWETCELDLARERVTFEKIDPIYGNNDDASKKESGGEYHTGDGIELRLMWQTLGEAVLDAKKRIKFPKVEPAPMVYRFRLCISAETATYYGETDNFSRRLQHYRTPGKSQMTNIWLSKKMSAVLTAGGSVKLDMLDEGHARKLRKSGQSSFYEKHTRRLYESGAICLALKKNEIVLNR